MNLFDLSHHTALVTGSSRGIGKAAAFALGRAGASLILHGASDSPALRATAAEAAAEGIACRVAIGDLGDPDAVARLATDCADADILVLNASVQSYGHIADFSGDEFARIFETNVRSSFQFLQAFAPRLTDRGWGRVIAIGSVNQAHPAPRLALYASSKAALRALVLTAAKEYAPHGVTVNTVTPGVIATDRNAKVLSDPAFAAPLRESIPARRFGRAEDCAGAVLFLASDAASYITGADLLIDGGMSL